MSLLTAGLLLVGCKDPEAAAAEAKQRVAADAITRGRIALTSGKANEAIALFNQAANATPTDAVVYMLLARAQKAAGNDTAAAMH